MTPELHVTDWWEVFRELAPWGIVLIVVLVDTWVIRRLESDHRFELQHRRERDGWL